MASVYSVTEVNSYIKRMFEQDFVLNNVYIKGEISNCKYHTSGHIYFTLKDQGGVMACVMFAGNRRGLNFKLEEGLKVTAFGTVNVYERDGKYQLYVREVKMDGQGDLYKRFELLKAELLEMGMFDASYKKPLPRFALKVGIVTAKTGAAIQDIINVSTRRNPHVQLYLYPAIVQGAEAAPTIVAGIKALDQLSLDVIIVGRGGGSLEDLWAFNEESVARAIFACNTPIISAVGHETDTTIADYVSDMRAPTPSAAAELAAFDYDAYLAEVNGYLGLLNKTMRNKYRATKDLLAQYSLRVKHLSPSNRIMIKRQEIDDILNRMSDKMKLKLERKRHELSIGVQRLEGLSPLNKLKSGYSYVSLDDGSTLKSVEQINKDDNIEIFLLDGCVNAKVDNIVKKDDFLK
ncbi:MAG: exodeoxyribonuclease VII large subunit [Lachnospiraceae bacterium]|nr:exodeoxyribonuclease VII large subunit [Lachnospiraceae bacterium]